MKSAMDLWLKVRPDHSRLPPTLEVSGRINDLIPAFRREVNDYGVVVVIGCGVVMIVVDPVPEAAALSA